MSLKAVSSPKKKPKKQFSRKSHSGYGAAPTKNFYDFKDYVRTEVDKKETAKVIREFIKENFPKEEVAIMNKAPEWCFTFPHFAGATIVWQNLGKPFPDNWNADTVVKNLRASLLSNGQARIAGTLQDSDEEEPVEQVSKKSIADIVQEKSREFIYEVELVIDEWFVSTFLDVGNYSPYLELKKIDAPYNVAKACHDYYVPLREEIKALLAKGDKDLEEGYRRMTLPRRKEYFELVNNIVTDCDKYMQSKKAVRKIKVAKPLTADKQIRLMKYLKESPEFKLTSINPMNVIGGKRLYTFDTKSRTLTEYVSTRGFEIKGTTLLHIDVEQSRETRLRKPDEFLQGVMKLTPTKIAAEWNNLTTKTNIPNGRINMNTILLRVLDK